MQRIAHVIAPAPFGGAESVVRALCEGAHRSGRDALAALILQRSGPAPLAAALRSAGVPVEEVRNGRRRYLAEVRSLAEVFRRREATLVHTHIYHADFVGYAAARRAGLPVVATLHGHTAGSLGNRVYEWLDRRLLRRFDAVVCVSEDARRKLLQAGCRAERLHVIRNGFVGSAFAERGAARAALGIEGDGPVAGWVGRLSIEKGADLFVEALQKLGRPDVQGLILGDGLERAGIERRIAATGVTAKCIGSRADAGSLMRALDVLVLSSRTEGTPMVLLEAMAARVPVAAFSVGGIPGVVNDEAAWLAAPGDTAALAGAIGAALERGEESRARSENAARILEREFGLDRWLSDLDRVYAAVTGGRAP